MKNYKFLGIMIVFGAIISNGVFAETKGIDQKVLINAGVGYGLFTGSPTSIYKR
ncbi:MAG: hypothetical protein Ta2A_04210 [Treponemataceae bacterium]|nr:MAG: hypothetical protein Ta2A_04210 [Treponemataceae bacterium]